MEYNECNHEECYWFNLDENTYKDNEGKEYKYNRVICTKCGSFWDEKSINMDSNQRKYITRAEYRDRKFKELHKLLQELEELSIPIWNESGYEK